MRLAMTSSLEPQQRRITLALLGEDSTRDDDAAQVPPLQQGQKR
jgi:hypothetical protein